MRVTMQSNFYRVTFKDSNDMTDFKTIKMSQDVQGIIGKSSDGSLHLQSVIFPRSKYSVHEATIRGYHIQQYYT